MTGDRPDDLDGRLARARARLYTRGVTEQDRAAFERLSAESKVASEMVTAPRALAPGRPRRRRARLVRRVGAVLATLAAASVLLVIVQGEPGDQAAPPTRLGFELVDLPLAQRLAQYPSSVPLEWQGAALAAGRDGALSRAVLQVPARYRGEPLLLVVRCPTADTSWTAETVWQGRGLSVEGARCGPLVTRELIAFTTTVSVRVEGDLPFAAAVLARSP